MTYQTYQLYIRLKKEININIGKLGNFTFPPGYYVYTGSSKNNIDARIKRHKSKKKNIRWHIDYLLTKASLNSIILCQSQNKVECIIAQALNRQFDCVPGFGASD